MREDRSLVREARPAPTCAFVSVRRVLLIEPVLAESSGSWLEVAISVAYPCTDLVLLWAVITLAYRVGIRPVLVLPEERWLDAEPYHERFTWTQKWPRANWTLAYQGNLHEVPEADFALLEGDMAKAAAATPA